MASIWVGIFYEFFRLLCFSALELPRQDVWRVRADVPEAQGDVPLGFELTSGVVGRMVLEIRSGRCRGPCRWFC